MLNSWERFRQMSFFSRLLYSLSYTLFLICYGPVYLLLTRGRRQVPIPWLQRLGKLPPQLSLQPTATASIWIHAVSVGEVNLLGPLVNSLARIGWRLYISTTTETGQELARKRFSKDATIHYFPLDLRWSCRRYLERIRPARILIVETEIWPNFIWEAARRSIPVAIVNGRISDRSFRRYRLVRRLLRPVLLDISHFCMQSRTDKERVLELGAPAERVHLVGNLKFDYQLTPDPAKEAGIGRIKAWLSGGGRYPIWLCGSTREGEEGLLAQVFSRLRERFTSLRLVVVPRHPHRAPAVAAEIEGFKLSWRLRSRFDLESDTGSDPPDCLIVDTIGELAYLYAIADVVFVGGSLVPTGGHNIIEAAYFSKPILFGPHMENFREVASYFLDSYAALQVDSAQELLPKLTGLLEDPAAQRWLGRNARKVIRDNKGALERTLELLKIDSLASPPG